MLLPYHFYFNFVLFCTHKSCQFWFKLKFNFYRMLFLAFKKVRMVKITFWQIHSTRSKNPSLVKLSVSPYPWRFFRKPWSEKPACIYHGKDSEATIQWYSLKDNHVLKSFSNLKAHIAGLNMKICLKICLIYA